MAGGSLLAAFKQYVGDALPGGSLTPELAPVRQYAAGVKQRAGQLVADPAGFARSAALDVLPNEAEANAARAKLMGGSLDPQAYQSYMGKLQDMGNFLGSIRVYHGSPHKFDKFDLSKMGTGEGAQAYGHGAYVAESPGVAQDYAESLSKRLPERLRMDGQVVRGDSMYSRSLEDVALLGRDGAIQKLDDNIRFNEKYAPDIAEQYKAVKAKIAAIDPAQIDLNRGNIYEANLRWPDAAREAADPLGPQHFLDWDKPLSEQPAAVRDSIVKAFDEIFAGNGAANYEGAVRQGMTVGEVINHLGGRGPKSGEMAARNAADLYKAGIPGIRYLDAGSRGTGQGTSNYVVFDDALIELLKRNGVPIGK